MKKLNWTAYSDKDLNQALHHVKKTISDSNGFITHFNLFSDLAVSLTIEIEEKDIPKLHRSLVQYLELSDLKDLKFDQNSEKNWIIFLNISFSSGKGNLRREVPSIPG